MKRTSRLPLALPSSTIWTLASLWLGEIILLRNWKDDLGKIKFDCSLLFLGNRRCTNSTQMTQRGALCYNKQTSSGLISVWFCLFLGARSGTFPSRRSTTKLSVRSLPGPSTWQMRTMNFKSQFVVLTMIHSFFYRILVF